MKRSYRDLERENVALRDRLAALETSHGPKPKSKSELKERILDGAIREIRRSGFQAELTTMAREAQSSPSAIYRHFGNRERLLQAVVQEIRREVALEMQRVGEIEDPGEALRAWMHSGFRMVERYGMLSAQICAKHIPKRYRSDVPVEDLYRFTGTLLKRFARRATRKPGLTNRSAVRIWFALVSPVRIRGCLDDGMSMRAIEEETLQVVVGAFIPEGGTLATRGSQKRRPRDRPPGPAPVG